MLKLSDILNYLNDRTKEPKILWSGGYLMTTDHTVNLPEPISTQPNGIVLVFSAYVSSTIQNYDWHSFFISKTLVTARPTNGHTFNMNDVNFSRICSKYLYISDKKIAGHASNNLKGTKNGITFFNATYVLRYIIGI